MTDWRSDCLSLSVRLPGRRNTERERHWQSSLVLSVRTLRRDFRERLIYLNLEYRHGHCRLLSDPGMAQRAPGNPVLYAQCWLQQVFPETDLRLVNTLTDSEDISSCLVWQEDAESAPVRPGLFSRLVDTIIQQQCIRELADGVRAEHLAPYRLIFLEGALYLVGEQHGRIVVLPLSGITAITVLSEGFERRGYGMSTHPSGGLHPGAASFPGHARRDGCIPFCATFNRGEEPCCN
ncbi:regulatory protein DeoR [Enterobacter cloacae]|uniref:Regulatory protein DeoR n=1 Tax=Enterobacter cloacae TaxID=550 RepID=A0A377LVS9_ENTCL|nr:regulatory protein DeoR [Enterobacter cloacae]